MKPVSIYKSLLYTGVFIVTAPIVITAAMFLFSGTTSDTEIKKEVVKAVVTTPTLPKVEILPIIDTVKPVIAKPKKKKIETVDTVKIVNPDTTILKTDTL